MILWKIGSSFWNLSFFKKNKYLFKKGPNDNAAIVGIPGRRMVSLGRCRWWFEWGLCLIHILVEVHLHRRRHGARNVGVCGLPNTIYPTHSRRRWTRVFIQSCCCCMACLMSCLLQCTLSQEVLVVIVEWGIAHFPVTADAVNKIWHFNTWSIKQTRRKCLHRGNTGST